MGYDNYTPVKLPSPYWKNNVTQLNAYNMNNITEAVIRIQNALKDPQGRGIVKDLLSIINGTIQYDSINANNIHGTNISTNNLTIQGVADYSINITGSELLPQDSVDTYSVGATRQKIYPFTQIVSQKVLSTEYNIYSELARDTDIEDLEPTATIDSNGDAQFNDVKVNSIMTPGGGLVVDSYLHNGQTVSGNLYLIPSKSQLLAEGIIHASGDAGKIVCRLYFKEKTTNTVLTVQVTSQSNGNLVWLVSNSGSGVITDENLFQITLPSGEYVYDATDSRTVSPYFITPFNKMPQYFPCNVNVTYTDGTTASLTLFQADRW